MLDSVLLPEVQTCLEQNRLWRGDAVLLCALSGGGDSVALLHTLAAARRRAGFALHACYVQHGLRGQSTRQDECFVTELCAQMNIPLHVYQAELNADMNTPGIETLARERRRQLFARCMEENRADGLLLAHHRDDQVETVLMRLLRGAGMNGLGGMRPCVPFGRGLLLRPFLELPKAVLLEALAQKGFAYREDESNLSCCTPRNTLRLTVLSKLEELFPGAGEHMAHTAALLRQEDDCLEQLARPLYQQGLYREAGIFAFRLETLSAAPKAIQARLLRRFVQEGMQAWGLAPEERALSYEDTGRLQGLAAGERGTMLNLPCGLRALRGWRYLFLLQQQGDGQPKKAVQRPVTLSRWAAACGCPVGAEGGIQPEGEQGNALFTYGGLCFRLSLTTEQKPPSSANEICLPPEWMAQAQWRFPLPGDSIRPLGAAGAKPLRRYLTDQKIDLPFRPTLPLLAKDSTVLWIPGLCTAEELRWKPEKAQWKLCLCTPPPYLPNQPKE